MGKLLKRNLSVIILLMLIMNAGSLMAQGTAINLTGNPPNPSAGLDVDFINKGVLLPRLTDVQRNAIVNPAEGLQIFNITSGCVNYYHNGLWYQLCGNCIPPPAPIAGNNSPFCAGDTLKLTASGISNATYYWTGPNGFTSTLQNPLIVAATPSNNGTYSVTATLNGCTTGASVTNVVVNALPVSTYSANPISPQPAQNVTFSPTVTGAAYSWTFQNGTPATSTAQNPVVQWASIGTYNVSLTVTQNGCSSTSSSQITVSNCTVYSQTASFNYTGSIQSWTVPANVCSITITARGAAGGFNGGIAAGNGASMQGTFSVAGGTVLKILVGMMPTGVNGGGGGTFVVKVDPASSDIMYDGTHVTPLIIAGGGGGSTSGGSDNPNKHGNVTTTGGSAGNQLGGTNGNGGQTENCSGQTYGTGGGGYLTNGGGSYGGRSFLNGGAGYSNGGYGGGGEGSGSAHGGGGGGYSGGAGNNIYSCQSTYGCGGGGGSYNAGSAQVNSGGVVTTNGSVSIDY
ncbi:MAG: PKD domain-containing protein [Bacteroidota bacterium]